MSKTIDEQIAELQAKKAEEERKAAFQEYPKHVTVDDHVYEARDAEHEKALLAGKGEAKASAVNVGPAPQPDPGSEPKKEEKAQEKAPEKHAKHDEPSRRGKR